MSAATVAAARRAYVDRTREVWERCYELTVTAVEDAPDGLDLASEALAEAVTEVEGAAYALLSVGAALPEVVVWPCRVLVDADEAFSRWRQAFDRLHGVRARVRGGGRSAGDPARDGWLGVVDTSIGHVGESGRQCERARLALWTELVETAPAPSPPAPLHAPPVNVPVTSPPDVGSASSSEEEPA